MKTIIVATDFSAEAENALEYAGAAAKDLNAKIILFSSFSISVHASNARLPATAIERLIDQNNVKLKERAEEVASTYGIEVDYESGLMLQVSEELAHLYEKHQAEVIVMGMAASSLTQDLFGNTTTAAIMKLKYPVLAVPLGAKYSRIKKILFACDVLRGVQRTILKRIRNFASALEAEVQIFHVQDKVKMLENDTQHLASKVSIDEGLEGISFFYKNVESGTVIEEIKKEIEEFNPDVLIMVPLRYGFWDSLIHRSKTRIMASSSKIPLFSIPVEKD